MPIVFRTDKDETKEIITTLPAKTYNYTKTDPANSNYPNEYYIYFDSMASSIATQSYKNINMSGSYKSELNDGEERDIDITLNVRFDALRNSIYIRQITLSQYVLTNGVYTKINTVQSDKITTTQRITVSVTASGWKLKKNSAFYIQFDGSVSAGYGGVSTRGTTVYWTVNFNIKNFQRKTTTTIKAPTITIPTIDRAYYKDTLIYGTLPIDPYSATYFGPTFYWNTGTGTSTETIVMSMENANTIKVNVNNSWYFTCIKPAGNPTIDNPAVCNYNSGGAAEFDLYFDYDKQRWIWWWKNASYMYCRTICPTQAESAATPIYNRKS